MSEVVVRPAESKDAEGIAMVHVKGWQSTYRGQIPDTYLDGMSIEQKTESWKKQLDSQKEDTYAIVAQVDGQIVGWSTGGVSRDEDVSKNWGELYAIYVLPNYQNLGVGSKLMSQALHMLKRFGYGKATLWVLDTNQETRSWYEHKGWRIEGQTKIEKHSGGFDLHETRYIIDL